MAVVTLESEDVRMFGREEVKGAREVGCLEVRM